MTPWLKILINLGFCLLPSAVSSAQTNRRGPFFVYEPPTLVEFSNVTGTIIPCKAKGNPLPMTRWVLADGTASVTDIPGLRHVRPDGSLVFPPFLADDYLPDVHHNGYQCVANNLLGTIGSREVRLKGVVKQDYIVEVEDEFVIAGNTAVFRCLVPEFVKEYISVTSWVEEKSSTVIQPTGSLGEKYVIQPTGELYVLSVQSSENYKTFRCHTRHRLTGDVIASIKSGHLIITDAKNPTMPRISDFKGRIRVKQGETLTLQCAAQAYPPPNYRWHKLQPNGPKITPVTTSDRMLQMDGTLVLYQAQLTDAGKYACIVNNSVGQEKIITDVLVSASLSATISPTIVVADLDRGTTLNCSISGYPVHTVQWRKDFKALPTQGRLTQLAKEVLHISAVKREDKGMYQCFVANEFESAQATVELTLGDDTPELEETFPERTLHPGPAVSLKCAASGIPLPKISWSLDDEYLPKTHRIRLGDFVARTGTVISFVNISDVRVEDGGIYKCVADNGVGSVAYAARINVLGPPLVRPMKNITVAAGENLTIRCPVAGYPITKIEWERDFQKLPFNHRQKVHDNGTLEIHHIDSSTDEGPFTCLAKNKEGQQAQSTIYVKVQVKPVIEDFHFPKSLREGQRSSVMCTVSSGDFPIKIRWFKDGVPIGTTNGIRLNEAADYSSTLLFESLRLEHKGNYTCSATNRAGTISHSATMVIHVPPRWQLEPGDVSVVKGKNILIDCQTEGFPRPRMRWTKAEGDSPRNFRPVVSSPHLQVFENGSLAITKADEDDGGFYLCQANNGIGQGLSKVVRFTINIAAHFKSKFAAEMVQKGHNTKMKCEAFGDKPITINWLKNKVSLNPSLDSRYELVETFFAEGITSEIIIRQADRRDSSLFSCIARNSFGQDETNIQLIVQEPPDSPMDVKIAATKSRSVKIEWTPPYNGNSPITQYIVQYKDDTEKWHGQTLNMTVTGSDTVGLIQGLRPAHIYLFRVLAENRLGLGEPSRVVDVVTDEETPGGPPVRVRAQPASSKSIIITWNPPAQDLQYGTIIGYYVGYKEADSRESYVYKTLEASEPGFKEDIKVEGLKKSTTYSVVVQAFNSKGAGPPSDESFAATLQNDPPLTPPLKVNKNGPTSVHLVWNSKTEDDNPITGYWLYQRNDNGDWAELKLPGEQVAYSTTDLRCGTNYEFFLVAFNSAGKGGPSKLINVRTDGTPPIGPENKLLVVTPNLTSATIHLNQWRDGGCPISNFVLRYRPRKIRKNWVTVSKRINPTQPIFEVDNLMAGASYDLQVTATNSAGSVEDEFVFTTLGYPTTSVPPKTVMQKDTFNLFVDLTLVIPVVVSVLVIAIVLIAVFAVLKHKHSSQQESQNGNSPYGFQKPPDCVPMTDMEKVAQTKHATIVDTAYYPLPYATTYLSPSGEKDNGTVYHQMSDEPLYATVKRTPRPPRLDGQIYHWPSAGTNQQLNHNFQNGDVKPNENEQRGKVSGLMRLTNRTS